MVAANGGKVEVLGQGEMKVSLGGLNEYHRVLVVKRLTQECFIWADFLTQHGCIVDFQRQIVIAGGKNSTQQGEGGHPHQFVTLLSQKLLRFLHGVKWLFQLPVQQTHGVNQTQKMVY